jgi:very-short-patch-repair endonuclease
MKCWDKSFRLHCLQVCDLGMWNQLAGLMSSSASSAKNMNWLQWHQAYLLMRQRYGVVVACPPELLQRSLAAHLALKAPRTTTHFEDALAEAVRQVAEGLDVQLSHAVHDPRGEGRLWVDVALPQLRIALEADGPTHFLRNTELRQQKGETRARDRLLRGWGWHVIVVPIIVWEAMYAGGAAPSHEQLVAGLQRHLEQHTGLVQRIQEGPATSDNE